MAKNMKLQPAKGGKSVSKKKVTVPVRYKDSAKRDAHHLAYITDKEREVLESMRGSLAWVKTTGPGGVPYLPPGATDGYGGRGTADVDAGSGRSNVSGGGRSSGGGRAGGVGRSDVGGGFSSNDRSSGGGADRNGGGGRPGGVGRSDVGGGFSSNDRSGGNIGGNGGRPGAVGSPGVGGGFDGRGGNNGLGVGVGGLGVGLNGGGYSGPKGGVIGPSDIGRAMSELAGTNAGRMGLAQASNALSGMRNSVSDVAWGGGGFFGETPSTNVQDKRDQGPLPGIAPGAFGNLGPNIGGLGGLFASGAAPSVAQQAAQTTPNAQFGNAVLASPIGPNAINTDPAFNARNVDQTVANALRSNTVAKSNPFTDRTTFSNMNAFNNDVIGAMNFANAPARPNRFGGLTSSQVNSNMGNAVLGMGTPSFGNPLANSDPLTGAAAAMARPTTSPAKANQQQQALAQMMANYDNRLAQRGYKAIDPNSTVAKADAMGLTAPTPPSPFGTPASARNASLAFAGLEDSMFENAAVDAIQAAQAPASQATVQSPVASSPSPDIAPSVSSPPESVDPGAPAMADQYSGTINNVAGALSNPILGGLVGLLSGGGARNPNLGNDGTNRGGNDRAIRGLLEAMNPQTPAPDAPGTVRPGNWVPPGLLMRPNPFPAVWQNRNPWRGYA